MKSRGIRDVVGLDVTPSQEFRKGVKVKVFYVVTGATTTYLFNIISSITKST